VDARHISVFTRVFRRAMAGHDASHPSAPSWPGLSRPSTSFVAKERKSWMPGPRPGMTPRARHKAGHGGVRRVAALSVALYVLAGVASAAFAAEPCDIPASLLSGGWDLKHVAEAVAKDKRLTVAVVGTGSSLLAGPDGPRSAYPARLEEALKHKLPGVDAKVVTPPTSPLPPHDPPP